MESPGVVYIFVFCLGFILVLWKNDLEGEKKRERMRDKKTDRDKKIRRERETKRQRD